MPNCDVYMSSRAYIYQRPDVGYETNRLEIKKDGKLRILGKCGPFYYVEITSNAPVRTDLASSGGYITNNTYKRMFVRRSDIYVDR